MCTDAYYPMWGSPLCPHNSQRQCEHLPPLCSTLQAAHTDRQKKQWEWSSPLSISVLQHWLTFFIFSISPCVSVSYSSVGLMSRWCAVGREGENHCNSERDLLTPLHCWSTVSSHSKRVTDCGGWLHKATLFPGDMIDLVSHVYYYTPKR